MLVLVLVLVLASTGGALSTGLGVWNSNSPVAIRRISMAVEHTANELGIESVTRVKSITAAVTKSARSALKMMGGDESSAGTTASDDEFMTESNLGTMPSCLSVAGTVGANSGVNIV